MPVSEVQLVNPSTASLKDVIQALNGFYSNYLERCIKENEEFAHGAELDCYRENCQMSDKVSLVKVSQHKF
jgi:hypothetical protein